MGIKIAVTKNDGKWTQTAPGACGTQFTIPWHLLEKYLQTGRVAGFQTLHKSECVDRFEVGDDGVTVFIGTKS